MADTVVRAVLEIQSRIKDLQKGVDALKGASKAAKSTKQEVSKANVAANNLGKTLTRFFGAAILGRFVKDSVGAFADLERQFRTTAVEAERLGMSAQQTVARVDDLTRVIQSQTGVLQTETLPVFNKFLGLTGDVEQAAVLLRAAVGAQEAGFKDLNTAANLLGSILQGEVIEPSKSLGLAFDQSRTAAEQQSEVLDQALDKFLNLSGGIKDTRGELDAANSVWVDFKLAVGEGASAITGLLAPAMRALLNTFKSIGPALVVAGRAFQGFFTGIALAGRFALDPRNWFADNFKEILSASFKAGFDSIAAEAEGAVETLAEIWAGAESGITQAAEAEEAARAALREEANARASKAAEERLAKERETARKAAEQRVQFERDLEDRLLSERLRAVEDGSEEQLELELEMLGRIRERAIEEAHARGADIDEVNRIFDEIDLIRREEHAESVKEIWEKQKKDYLAILKKQAKEAAKLQDAEAKMTVEKERFKRQAALDTASQAVELGRTIFGENKAIAVAETIIHTARGVMSALSLFPPNIPLAALIVATGAAQVAKILSTNPGGSGGGGGAAAPQGFDDPVNDRLAGLAGRRWAEDLLRMVTGGMHERLAQAGPILSVEDGAGGFGRVTTGDFTDDSGAITFNGPVFADRVSLRRLDRLLQRARRMNRRRLMR